MFNNIKRTTAYSTTSLRRHRDRSWSVPCPSLEPETKSGVVEGVWIFHRHGDRAPSSPLWREDSSIEEEAAFWRTRLPQKQQLDRVSHRFPPRVHHRHRLQKNGEKTTDDHHGEDDATDQQQQPFDIKREPFGYLTKVGTHQMYNTGKRFARRYGEIGIGRKNNHSKIGTKNNHKKLEIGKKNNHNIEKNKNNHNIDHDDDDYDLRRNYDIEVYSTNYLRTITSAQFFLHGLIPTNNNHNTHHQKKSNSNSNTTDTTESGSIHVHVRNRENDTLNAFDKNPERMLALVKDVVSTPHFQAKDGEAVPLATDLARYLPGLANKRDKKRLFGGPSGINWIHATDHFVCRAAHGLRLTQIAAPKLEQSCAVPRQQQDQEDRVSSSALWPDDDEQQMEALAHPTMAHLAWRFHQWYKSPPLLSAIAAPPLQEIARDIRRTYHHHINRSSNTPHQKGPMKIYSCHDVTILSILYGLDATLVSSPSSSRKNNNNSNNNAAAANSNGPPPPRRFFWPPYATTLVFELVRVDDSRSCDDNKDDNDDTQGKNSKKEQDYVVRILLNGTPLESNFTEHGKLLMSIDEFSDLVAGLEANNKDDNADTETMERDMATWTG